MLHNMNKKGMHFMDSKYERAADAEERRVAVTVDRFEPHQLAC